MKGGEEGEDEEGVLARDRQTIVVHYTLTSYNAASK